MLKFCLSKKQSVIESLKNLAGTFISFFKRAFILLKVFYHSFLVKHSFIKVVGLMF